MFGFLLGGLWGYEIEWEVHNLRSGFSHNYANIYVDQHCGMLLCQL